MKLHSVGILILLFVLSGCTGATVRGLERAIVFVHSLPSLTWHPGASVYFQRNNRPDLSDPILFVQDLGPERNQVLARAFPDRVPYVMGTRERELALAPLNP